MLRTTIWLVGALLIGGCFGGGSGSSSSTTLSGTVVAPGRLLGSPSEGPAAGWFVAFEAFPGRVLGATQTDAEGRFEIDLAGLSGTVRVFAVAADPANDSAFLTAVFDVELTQASADGDAAGDAGDAGDAVALNMDDGDTELGHGGFVIDVTSTARSLDVMGSDPTGSLAGDPARIEANAEALGAGDSPDTLGSAGQRPPVALPPPPATPTPSDPDYW